MKRLLFIVFLFFFTAFSQLTKAEYKLTFNDYVLLNKAMDRIEEVVAELDVEEGTELLNRLLARIDQILDTTENERQFEILAELEAAIIYQYTEQDDDLYKETAEDCFDDEYFDEEDQVCYLKEDELDEETDFAEGADYDAHDNELVLDDAIVFDVIGNTINNEDFTPNDDEPIKGQVLHLWTTVLDLIPSQHRRGLESFVVYESEDTLGYVELGEDGTTWELGLSTYHFNHEEGVSEEQQKIELFHSIIHEYFHIFSLRKGQLDYRNTRESSCNTLLLIEGCAYRGSYLYQFYVMFWDGEVQETFEGLAGGSHDEATADTEEFYNAYVDHFVSDYASTNVVEDFAESFALFVLAPTPAGNTVAEQKVRYFEKFPELVSLRQHMRNVISKNL